MLVFFSDVCYVNINIDLNNIHVHVFNTLILLPFENSLING